MVVIPSGLVRKASTSNLLSLLMKVNDSTSAICFPARSSAFKSVSLRGAALPVFFGGESGPALRRVAEYGDGWIGFNLTPDEAAAKIRRIEELLKLNGRKRSDSRARRLELRQADRAR